ncbi:MULTISPECIES: hypothetical protein [unclassified Methylobacterium]|uniref:hypothetical protein n=1 Tax=unclassified Methylobacterium TaxID=2615210 RepID=UPI000A694644|nr:MULTISPECIES: hypothetical protein [unclassified Methylobacterium]MCK2055511.1 hypothetical protein [Methylobacterium sp. 37f]
MQRTHEDARFQALVRRVRTLVAPEHLLLGAVLVLGWAALIAWTGNGSVGWQARLCADADASVTACRMVAPSADGRVS